MSNRGRTVTYVRSTNSSIYILFVGFAIFFMGVLVNHSDTMGTNTGKEVSPAYGLMFALIGLWMMSMGIIPLFIEPRRKKLMIAELKQMNNTVIATIVGFPRNPGNKINKMAPYLMECRYFDDATGLINIYYGNEFHMPDNRFIGCRVKVYIDKTDPSRYYVDMTQIETPVLSSGSFGGGAVR